MRLLHSGFFFPDGFATIGHNARACHARANRSIGEMDGLPNHVILVEPEIPQNTGNIARTCAATGSTLHLVGKLGFSLDDRYLKRAGLDYWPLLTVSCHETLEDCLQAIAHPPCYYLTTKAPRAYHEAAFENGCALIFGKETRGLPEPLLQQQLQRCVRIPMLDEARSLNLSNAVAIVLYEALRQQGFAGLSGAGKLVQA